MPVLTESQYDIVISAMTATTGCLVAALVYFLFSKATISARFRAPIAVVSAVVGLAAFHTFALISRFTDAYTHDGVSWAPTGVPSHHTQRYTEWLFSAPLLLIALVMVLRLEREQARSLTRRLVGAALLMIALGYPAELSNNYTAKVAFWSAAVVPFLYVMYLVWFELNRSLFGCSDEVGLAIVRARLLLAVSWLAYPLAFWIPTFELDEATGEVLRNVVYAVVDVVSKAGFGVLVFRVAQTQSSEDPSSVTLPNPTPDARVGTAMGAGGPET